MTERLNLGLQVLSLQRMMIEESSKEMIQLTESETIYCLKDNNWLVFHISNPILLHYNYL